MKQTKHLLSILLLCLLSQGIKAQTWTASSPVAAGAFYLYNVGCDGFLYGHNDWDAFASLTKQGGIPFTFEASDKGDGYFKLATSPTYNGRYFGNDLYVDKESSNDYVKDPWLFTLVEGTENTYVIQETRKNRYLVINSSTLKAEWTAANTLPTGDNGYWKLATRQALIDNLANATEQSPIDVTFAISNPYFGRNTNTGVWTGDFWAHGGVDQNNCIEQWNRNFDMYQTITGLPNGVYKMKCQGFYRMGGGGNDANTAAEAHNNGTETLTAKYYINNTEGSLKSIFDYSLGGSNNSTYNSSTAVTINGSSMYVPSTLSRASECFRAGEYWNEEIKAVVTDGTLRIGFRNTATTSNDWAAYDNVILTYYGIDLTALVENYDDLLSTAQGLTSSAMQASVKTQLETAITTATTSVDKTNQAWLESAISTLSTAVSTAQTSNALYTGVILTAVNAMKAQSTSEDVKAALQTNYDNGEYASVSDVYSFYQQQEIAALGTADNTPFTSVIINPAFELRTTAGWTGDPGLGGIEANWCAEKWNTTFDVYQTITGLPNGYYSMTLQGFYRVGDGTNDASKAAAARAAGHEVLNANYYLNEATGQLMSIFDSEKTKTDRGGDYNTSTAVNINGTDYYVPSTMARTAAFFDEGEYTNAAITAVVTDGTLRLGVKKSTANSADWAIWDNFTLTYLGSYAPTNYTDVALTLNIENDEVNNYLANTTYDMSTPTTIHNYNTDASARNDQPATVLVPLPVQTSAATLYVSLSSEYSSPQTYTIASGKDGYELTNLMPARTYYYKVVGDGDAIVTNGTITTTGSLRMIKADGIANMRDLGGWQTSDGNTIRYGKIFRGTELRGGRGYTASDDDLAMLKNELNIVAEVDLREDVDLSDGILSNSPIDGATYYFANLNRWSEDALRTRTDDFKAGFNLIYEAVVTNSKAAYFHCILGADRTGCFAMLLEGLLGLPVDQMYKDYELTSFSSAGLREKTGIDSKLKYINLMPGTTLQERFFNYWRYAVGIDKDKLLAFIDAMVEGSNPKTLTSAIADYVNTPAIADGEYYLYFPTLAKFLGRGNNYGTRIVAEHYGIPAAITTNSVGVTTIKFLDNNLYMGSDCYTDKADNYSSISWIAEKSGEQYLLRTVSGYLKMTADAEPKALADATAGEATPVTLKSVAEHDAIVADAHESNILAAAVAAGFVATDLSTLNTTLSTDYTAVPSTAVIKSATAGNTTDWPITVPDYEQGGFSAYNAGSYGGEVYQKNGVIQQTVDVPRAGLYKLTLNAFYRCGSNSSCYALGQRGYEISNAYVSVNDTYFAQIPAWYSDCAGSANPQNTTEATALIEQGKYAVEVYAYIGDEKKATIAVHVPGYVSECWCLFTNFALTEYAKNVTISEDATEAPAVCDFAYATLTRSLSSDYWNTFSVPFDLTAEQLNASALKDAEIYAFDSSDATDITFAPATAIEAGKPYLVKPTQAVVNPSFAGVSVQAVAGLTEGEAGHVQFVGQTYNRTLAGVSNVCYLATNGNMKKLSATGSIKGLRAYFIVSNPSSVKLFFSDTPTSITSLDLEEQAAGQLYDLSGRHVSRPQRGIYIQNGKKILVK